MKRRIFSCGCAEAQGVQDLGQVSIGHAGDPAGDGPNPSGYAPASTEDKNGDSEPPDLHKYFAFPQLHAPHPLPRYHVIEH